MMSLNWQLIVQGALGSLGAGIFLAVLSRVMDWRISEWFKSASRGQLDREIPRKLRSYLNHLSARTLEIKHPWMEEGQALGDILVPVGLINEDRRVDLRAHLAAHFQGSEVPRLLILGAPGSGKSIAMGDVARFLPTLKRVHPFTPVMLTFSDLKGASTHEDLEKVVAEKLMHDQFTDATPDTEAPAHFMADHLYNGDIVLLIDGYDELDRDNRVATARFVQKFLTTYARIPAVLASRLAVYERELPLDSVVTASATMAPFSPLAIARFVSQWRFSDGKSSQELLAHINGKAHLNELASNPLMLTIICYLYVQPKYLLPDNRVEFYRECCRALLERWDVATKSGRPNRFETDHKMAVLSQIAYNQISNGGLTDEEIKADLVLEITRRSLQTLSMNPSDCGRIVREIVENSGLLVDLPPDGYRFPHRTFLEFFAATHLYEQENVKRLLELYEPDTAKWRPTLLMYAGLCKSKDSAAKLLRYLSEKFTKTQTQTGGPDVTVFSALIESSFAAPEIAEETLSLASENLTRGDDPNLALVDELGYIGANTKWTYSAQARAILKMLLAKAMAGPTLQAVILAAMRCRTDMGMRPLIAERLGDLDLVEVFIQAGQQASYYLSRLLELGIDAERKRRLTDGLREGNHLKLLADIMIESTDAELSALSGRALYDASSSADFVSFLDEHEAKQFSAELSAKVERHPGARHWPLPNPKTEAGRHLALAIAYCAVPTFTQVPLSATPEKRGSDWLGLIVRMIMAETGTSIVVQPCPRISHSASSALLNHLWRTLPWRGSFWNRFCRWEPSSLAGDFQVFMLLGLTGIFASGALELFALMDGANLLAARLGFGSFSWLSRLSIPDIAATLAIPLLDVIFRYVHWRRDLSELFGVMAPIARFAFSVDDGVGPDFLRKILDLESGIHAFAGALILVAILAWMLHLACFSLLLLCNAVVIVIGFEEQNLVKTALFSGRTKFDISRDIWLSSMGSK